MLLTPWHRRAVGLARTILVGAATLAILVVAFLLYDQYTQLDPHTLAELQSAQAGGTPATPPSGDGASTSVSVGPTSAQIGGGRELRLSIYPREGTRAIGEVSARDWVPLEEGRLRVAEPDVRLRTRAGNDIRATAEEGILEGPKGGSGAFDPKRGRLMGNVVIEIDRRSDEDKARLPADQRDHPRPEDLLRVTLDEIEFDVEFARIVVPGAFHLTGTDVDMQAAQLEARFDEVENRAEYVRIEGGGAITLRQGADAFSPDMATADAPRELSFVQALRATIEQRMRVAPADASQPASPKPATRYVAEDGTPILPPEAAAKRAEGPSLYAARFERDILAVQTRGAVELSRLTGDALEIIRNLSADRGTAPLRAEPAPDEGSADTAASTPDTPLDVPEELRLTWSGRLVIDELRPDDERATGVERTRIIASGAPVRLVHAEGTAEGGRFVYDPDARSGTLAPVESHTVLVSSTNEGRMTGQLVAFSRVEGAIAINVTGPGMLERDARVAADAAAPADDVEATATTVSFEKQLDVTGRVVNRRRLTLRGTLVEEELRLLDTAHFTGGVQVQQEETGFVADDVLLTFSDEPVGRDRRQTIDRIDADGHVLLTQNEDYLRCRALQAEMAVDDQDRQYPRRVTARGGVDARQGTRLTTARDHLVLEFASVTKPAPPFDVGSEIAKAAAAGIDPTTIDWEARRRAHEQRTVRALVPTAFDGQGNVRVTDLTDQMELVAVTARGTVTEQGEVETAHLVGSPDTPALVRQGAYSITGPEVTFDGPRQWANVPGPGRMTLQSRRDLDGAELKDPVPIGIQWSKHMEFNGADNRAVFEGRIHADSEGRTTVDCTERLIVGFQDAAPPAPQERVPYEWLYDDFFRPQHTSSDEPQLRIAGFNKEPIELLAVGTAVVRTSETDPDTGALLTRARLAGPQLSVDLRSDVSRMLIDGPGDLLMEDFRATEQAPRPRDERSMFSLGGASGPSKTLIQWSGSMWYDFANRRTRFERDVDLRHFSGAALAQLEQPGAPVPASEDALSTFLKSDALTVDFVQPEERRRRDRGRVGDLSSEGLRQFQATGRVRLTDTAKGLWVTANDITYERPRSILIIEGTDARPATLLRQEQGKLPREAKGRRILYELETGRIDIKKITFSGQ